MTGYNNYKLRIIKKILDKMQTLKVSKLVVLLIYYSFSMVDLNAQSSYKLKYHNVRVEGTSNLHDWAVKANQVTCKANMSCEESKIKGIQSFSLEIPVKDLVSEKKSKIMDNNIYEALKEKSYPTIEFKFSEIKSTKDLGATQELIIKGELTIAGVTKKEEILVRTKQGSNGEIMLNAEAKLFMTDFGVKPPKAMFNMLTTGNEIKIPVELSIQKN